MKRLTTCATLGLAGLLACGDSTGIQPADLEGTWTVTVLQFSQVTGALTVDVIEDLDGSASVVIEEDGAFQFTIAIGGDTDSDSGTLTVTGSDIEMDFQGEVAAGTISRNGDIVTIELDQGVSFDVDEDGFDEDVTVRIVMEKQ